MLASAGPFIDLDRLIAKGGPSVETARVAMICVAVAFCVLLLIGMYATRNDVR